MRKANGLKEFFHTTWKCSAKVWHKFVLAIRIGKQIFNDREIPTSDNLTYSERNGQVLYENMLPLRFHRYRLFLATKLNFDQLELNMTLKTTDWLFCRYFSHTGSFSSFDISLYKVLKSLKWLSMELDIFNSRSTYSGSILYCDLIELLTRLRWFFLWVLNLLLKHSSSPVFRKSDLFWLLYASISVKTLWLVLGWYSCTLKNEN